MLVVVVAVEILEALLALEAVGLGQVLELELQVELLTQAVVEVE
jgi:hypothetical protein